MGVHQTITKDVMDALDTMARSLLHVRGDRRPSFKSISNVADEILKLVGIDGLVAYGLHDRLCRSLYAHYTLEREYSAHDTADKR
jgi:hypothetical protein